MHVSEASEFANYIKNHKLCLVEGADHEFTSHQHQLASIVYSFVKLDPKNDDDSGNISTSNQDSMKLVGPIMSRI